MIKKFFDEFALSNKNFGRTQIFFKMAITFENVHQTTTYKNWIDASDANLQDEYRFHGVWSYCLCRKSTFKKFFCQKTSFSDRATRGKKFFAPKFFLRLFYIIIRHFKAFQPNRRPNPSMVLVVSPYTPVEWKIEAFCTDKVNRFLNKND